MRLAPDPLLPAGNKIPVRAVWHALTNEGRSIEGFVDSCRACSPANRLFYLPSGRAALWLILKALSSIKPDRKKVIIPAYTCPAIVSAILNAGLQPVLVDINLEDFGFLERDLRELLDNETLAVIVVHLLGVPANLKRISRLCEGHGAFLVEDAAQAGNIRENSTEVRCDASFFSFGRGKPFSVLYGGLALLESQEAGSAASCLYTMLREPSKVQWLKYLVTLTSYLIFSNRLLYRIPKNLPFLHLGQTIFEPEFDVAKGLPLPARIMGQMVGLLKREQETRSKTASFYYISFKELPGIKKLPGPGYPYVRYPLVLEEIRLRDRLLEQLRRRGIGATSLYPVPLNELPALREVLGDRREYANARLLSKSLITLPVHSGVQDQHRKMITRIVKQCLETKQWDYRLTAKAFQ